MLSRCRSVPSKSSEVGYFFTKILQQRRSSIRHYPPPVHPPVPVAERDNTDPAHGGALLARRGRELVGDHLRQHLYGGPDVETDGMQEPGTARSRTIEGIAERGTGLREGLDGVHRCGFETLGPAVWGFLIHFWEAEGGRGSNRSFLVFCTNYEIVHVGDARTSSEIDSSAVGTTGRRKWR